MESLESTSQSFIVKVWVEDAVEADGRSVWHGHITHVLSGKRHYVKSLDEIQGFIAPHLEEMGVKLDTCWRIAHWFKHLWMQR
jgi:hypothetical protein